MYPPRCVIEVSSRECCQSSTMSLEIGGVTPQDLHSEIHLIRGSYTLLIHADVAVTLYRIHEYEHILQNNIISEEDMLKEYCLMILKPKIYPKERTSKIYCILSHNLDATKDVSTL